MGIYSVPSWDQLVGFARTLRGTPLETLSRGLAFHVETEADRIVFIPGSGAPRPVTRKNGEEFLAELSNSGIMKTGHYTDITQNSSYLLALVSAYASRAD
jgi:hypothetical protein